MAKREVTDQILKKTKIKDSDVFRHLVFPTEENLFLESETREIHFITKLSNMGFFFARIKMYYPKTQVGKSPIFLRMKFFKSKSRLKFYLVCLNQNDI